jgi:hypothetical protein
MNVKTLIVGAISTLGLAGLGCRDYDKPSRTPSVEEQRGTGGSGDLDHDGRRVGDGKIGNENGVIDDGEGPLEDDGKADDKIGDRPGVVNDGEGPIEERQ